MPEGEISVTFLTDGGQAADAVANRLADFLSGAQRSLDICIYDANLPGDAGTVVQNAITSARDRGVSVRIAYFHDTSPGNATDTTEEFIGPFADQSRAIHAMRGLMHDKYVVRDAGTPDAVVWTGSTNWTTDSWTRQENVIIILPSPDLAGHFEDDFEQMWNSGHIENTGDGAGGTAMLSYGGETAQTSVWFSPGDGTNMSHAVARSVSRAQNRVWVVSPVITDGPILGALLDLAHDGRVPVQGVFDRTQMEQAVSQWEHMPTKTWKIGAFKSLVSLAHLASKRSTPYAPGSVHDYLHAKLVVVDDAVFTGSYNLSHNGETNAENLSRVDNAALADLCAGWIEQVAQRYSSQP
jgi:phosphatidylserine/phosphatidylglycerophosphate/cardiolipin synthase-like enzyme